MCDRRWPKLLAVFFVLLLGAACAPAAAPAPATAVPATPVPQAAPPTAPPAPAGAANPDATITIATTTDVTTLDPNTDTVITNRNVHLAMFDTLIERDNQMQFKPGLALSWENLDPNTWKFTLRKNVKFHDGNTFSAQDVKFTIDRIKTDQNLKSKMTIYVDAIAEVVVNDESTVTFKTKEPYPLLLTRLSAVPIVSKATLEKTTLDAFAKNPVGTGPFKFVEWVKDQRVVLERFDDHWRGKTKFKRLVFRPIPEPATRVNELLTGGVDIISGVPIESIESLQKANIEVKGVPSVRILHGMMNMSVKPFDNVQARQAVNYAIDVDSILKNLLKGHGYRSTQPVDPLTFGYSKDIQPYPYDPAKAKQLLTQAGYPNGFEVQFEAPEAYKPVAEVIAQQLAQVGIRATIVVDQPSVQIKKIQDKKNEPFYLFTWGSSTFDADGTTYTMMRSGQIYSVTSLPELDKLVDRAHTITDREERGKLYQQAHQLIRDQAAILFLWQLEDLYGVRKGVNWVPRVDEVPWFFDASVNR